MKSLALLLLASEPFLASAWLSAPRIRQQPSSTFRCSKHDNEEEDDMIRANPLGPEKSQMKNYIMDYLRRGRNEEEEPGISSSTFTATPATHCVALPMDNCDGLMLELESIQRAILYHCPILVHACIPQATTRLPLLFVNAGDDPSANEKLFNIVDRLTKKHLFRTESEENEGENSDKAGTRTGKVTPFMLRFKTLELDGAQNEVLQTVAQEEGAAILNEYVDDLAAHCQQQGWTTELPTDPHSEEEFRPRVPFMRLPDNWDDLLSNEYAGDADDEEERFLTSDQGGNGISPIFWFKWSEDDFGSVRMREIAVFQRRPGFEGLNEQSFYLPYDSIALPTGDESLTKEEMKYSEYQERRMVEAERIQAGKTDEDDKDSNPDDRIPNAPSEDMMLSKTRERLELLYNTSAAEYPLLEQDEEDESPTESVFESDKTLGKGSAEDDSGLDEWTKQRIDQIIASRQKARSEIDLTTPKDKPPVEENEVFQKYKQGTLVPPQKEVDVKPELPPFPSREHCTGFWKVISSPTGFDVEEGDATRSDNLILRVDGTTAGGPILDRETRQKAAGGTWRFQPDDDTLLIRLVIPPHKDRILVMQGKLTEASFSSNVALARSSFGIPALEERQERSASELDNMLLCSGDVWIEDAVTKGNRQDIGTFSLTKIDISSNPDSYTITIPRPVRNQD